jgi:glycosyltransferase involved in cell wall biosynthesis
MKRYRDDIRLLPNAIEVSAYPFHVRERVRPHMLWLRAFHRIYNPKMGPAVLARVAASSPDAQLTMIGRDKKDGSLQETKRAAAALQVKGRLAFPGAVPKRDVPAWLSAADVFLNTTDVDNTPVSVLEAMAAGLCIVSTNVGGIPYLLEDGHDALLVPPRDPEAMAQAVRRIITEPGLAAALSQNARAKAEKLDWSVVLPQWEDLIGSLSRKRPRS